MLQAKSSGAKVIGLANGGADLINAIKQAGEFGITQGGQALAGMVVFISDVHALGMQAAQGLVLTEAFYWDLNEGTRAWSKAEACSEREHSHAHRDRGLHRRWQHGRPHGAKRQEGGFDVLICDRNPVVLDQLRAEGLRVTNTVADCAGEDAVVVLLASDEQIMATMTGPGGLAGSIPAGHAPVVCIMSTTLPDTLVALQGPLAAAGARLIDAPVSGGTVGAQDGTLSILLGGAEDDVWPL